MGYASLRALRNFPEFPEKAAMVRGAKWGGLAFAGLVALAFGVMWLGTSHGLSMLSFGVSMGVFWAGFVTLIHAYETESNGVFVAVQYWSSYRRRGPEQWVEDWRARRAKFQRLNRVLVFVWVLLIAGWLSAGVWGYWDFDRGFLALAADARLGRELQQELNDPRVVEVVPMHGTFEGPLIPLHVYVTAGTSSEAGQRLAEQLRQALARGGERNAWRIVVRPKYGHTLTRATYAPPGVTLPPGAERQHPRPRRW